MLQNKTILSFLFSLFIICTSCAKVNLISLPPLPPESHIQTKRDFTLYLDLIEFRGLDKKYYYQETEELLLRYIDNARYFKKVFSSSTVQRPNDGNCISMKAIITPQEEHTFDWRISWPAIYPMPLYWPLQSKMGSVSVKLRCDFYDNNGKHIITLNSSYGEEYSVRFYGFFLSGDAKKKLMKCYEKVFEQISFKMIGVDRTFVQTLKQIEKPSYLAKIRDEHIEDIDYPDFNTDPRKKDIAIVIGVENYRGLPKSEYSRSDASTVNEYLKAMGFLKRNIMFMQDDKANLSDIIKTVESWLPNRVKKDSKVFFYYSGHGAPEPESGSAYLVPYDGDPNYLQDTAYPLKRLYEKLGTLRAAEVVVVLDSCFSGAGGRSVLARGARPLVVMAEVPVAFSNLAIITATQGSQISTSSLEKGHGVFTYYFLKAIKDGKKTLLEIYEYMKPLVEDEARILNVEQSPSISPDINKLKGKFCIRR